MTESFDERELQSRIERLPRGLRRDLLRVLSSEPHVRVDVIRQVFERPELRGLGDALIDLESDEWLRWRLIELLRMKERSG